MSAEVSYDSFSEFPNNTFRNLFQTNDLSDVTLVGKDSVPLKAHRVILSSASHVFREIFQMNNLHPVIYMRGCDYETISNMLEFIYTGKTQVEESTIQIFAEVMEEFQLHTMGSAKNEGLVEENLGQVKNSNLVNLVKEFDDIVASKMQPSENYTKIGSGHNRRMKKCLDCPCENDAVTIKRHIESNHMNESKWETFKCGVCEKEIKTRQTLRNHMTEKHGPRFPCDICNSKLAVYNSALSLKRHQNENCKFECPTCKKTQKTKNALEKHKLHCLETSKYEEKVTQE